MKYFVNETSIVRKIWGSPDTVLFIFAGAAAEFALNKAVDWLYYTGRIPADPIGRLFSTVAYSQQIIFSEESTALVSIDKITMIHKGVEQSRAMQIPDWAYLDVLYLLIDYSIRSYELLERKLTINEQKEVFDVFFRIGQRMELKKLPDTIDAYNISRESHLEQNLLRSEFTIDLYKQYNKHLGSGRYLLLLQIQSILVPARVKTLLHLKTKFWIRILLALYKFSGRIGLDKLLKEMLLPAKYKRDIKALQRG